MQGATVDLLIRKSVAGNLRFDLWYAGTDRFDITILQPGGAQAGPFTSPATNQQSDQQFLGTLNYYHRGSEVDFSEATNGQRQILIDMQGDTGTYTIRIIGSSVSDGSFFASLNPARTYNDNRFLSSVYPGASICDYASAMRIIVPTDYVYDSTYVDLDGISRHRGDQGDLWLGSSAGPTLDGRLGVDIAVPGELNIGAYSPGTYYSQFTFNVVEGSNGYYGLQNAVSAAAPVLTGTIALMMEVNPELTFEQVRDLLHQTGRQDEFTGQLPNARWGYGKLDALALIEATQQTLRVLDQGMPGLRIGPNPATDRLQVVWPQAEVGKLQLFDLQGRLLQTYFLQPGAQTFPLPNLPSGLYGLRFDRAGPSVTRKLMIR